MDGPGGNSEYSSISTEFSILDKLRAPRLSDRMCKQINTNPLKRERRAKGKGASEPENVSASG